ncbi:aminotransferase class III-fold pyridoxal phosphate-dependent enzyme [Aquimarina aquimarini]|uniref:aminotransferase class III-fold pyridoxal phosphate-dependent enzyme n=1 Tax=Aquimarina aquimarini TaxID=1191734 RepID=UPI000D55E46A|nr:aminotransferase class III-fold pyridoxal phosphate-dependent enzyme [Aquimarina aquimarini]
MEEKLIIGSNSQVAVSTVLKEASTQQLDYLKERIEAGLPSFLSSINPVFEESVQVAYMLSEISNHFQKGEYRKTFFGNSHLEAVHGAIKVGRHAAKELFDKEGGKVVVLDSLNYYKKIFDPLQKGKGKALIPGVEFLENISSLATHIQNKELAVAVIKLEKEQEVNDTLLQILIEAHKNTIVTVLDMSCLDIDQIKVLPAELIRQSDVLVWGEALTDNRFPFGAFSTKNSIHKPWNSFDRALLHSSTYGGNGLVLGFVRNVLLKQYPDFNQRKYNNVFRKIKKSEGFKFKMASKYMNEYLNFLFRTTVSMNFEESRYSYFITKGKKYLDCVGGSGCNARGHNRLDIIDDVLEQHDTTKDYFEDLEKEMALRTGLSRAMMGNSGASAVEMGIIMGMLANKGKKKIVVFNGNYAGKTLIAINGTNDDHSHFEPLYADVEIINPYVASARKDLENVLLTNEVGLVWFEHIQGGALLKIPTDLLSLLAKHKTTYKYLIGIDEILHGVHRTGDFLSFDTTIIEPDIITFAKALSNMVFPTSVVMMSQQVIEAAEDTNYETVQYYKNVFKNQLGAHLALDVLRKSEMENIAANVKEKSAYLQQQIGQLFRKSNYFKNIEIVGFHIRFNLNMKAYPFKYFSYKKATNIITNAFYKKAKIITFLGRMLPPLNSSKEDIEVLIKGVEKMVSIPGWYFIWIGIKQYVHMKYLMIKKKL